MLPENFLKIVGKVNMAINSGGRWQVAGGKKNEIEIENQYVFRYIIYIFSTEMSNLLMKSEI